MRPLSPVRDRGLEHDDGPLRGHASGAPIYNRFGRANGCPGACDTQEPFLAGVPDQRVWSTMHRRTALTSSSVLIGLRRIHAKSSGLSPEVSPPLTTMIGTWHVAGATFNSC